jgi:hypothetical protein
MVESMRIALVVTSLLVTTSLAAAEPPGRAPARKNPRTGLVLALGGTAAGFGLALWTVEYNLRPQATNGDAAWLYVGGVAAMFGPSIGRLYAHASIISPGSVTRSLGLGVAALGLAAALVSQNGRPARVAAEIGGGLLVAGAVYDIATTPSAVERYNRNLDITLAPTALRAHDGSLAPGFAFAGRF